MDYINFAPGFLPDDESSRRAAEECFRDAFEKVLAIAHRPFGEIKSRTGPLSAAECKRKAEEYRLIREHAAGSIAMDSAKTKIVLTPRDKESLRLILATSPSQFASMELTQVDALLLRYALGVMSDTIRNHVPPACLIDVSAWDSSPPNSELPVNPEPPGKIKFREFL